MTRIVKAKLITAYAWECPGCGEGNLGDKTYREAIHMLYNMDYISVKCSACNASYIVEGSCGWLTAFRTEHGGRLDNLKKIETKKPDQIKYTREELTQHKPGVAQCFLCGGHGKDSDAIIHDTRCAFSDPAVDHVYVGGRL